MSLVMKSQRKRDEYVFDDWASVHGRLLPWSEDQTTTHYESAPLRFLQRQPSSNEPSFWQLDETLELTEEDDPLARASGRTDAWLLSSAAGSGLIAAVLFGRVLLYSGGDAHAAPPAPQVLSTQLAPPQPSAANPPLSADTVEAPQPQSAIEVSHPAAPSERAQHLSTSHGHTRIEPAARDEHLPEHVGHTPSIEHAPPPTAAPGTLRINSRPWSQVFIDDRLIGNTPQLDISLPAGSHAVRLTNPEFGMSKVFSVRVPAGETVTRVETLEE